MYYGCIDCGTCIGAQEIKKNPKFEAFQATMSAV